MDWFRTSISKVSDSVSETVSETSKHVLERAESLIKGDTPFPIFVISFRDPDHVCVVHASDEIKQTLTDTLEHLRPGLSTRPFADHYGAFLIPIKCFVISDIKSAVEQIEDTSNEHALILRIRGDPFASDAPEDECLHIRRVVTVWMEKLQRLGWAMHVCVCLSPADGLDSCFFDRATKPLTDETYVDVFAVSLQDSDDLLMVNASVKINEAAKESVQDYLQKEEKKKTGDIVLKIKGNPWDPSTLRTFDDNLKGKRIILDLLRTFALEEYRLCGAVNLQNNTTDTLMFVKEEGFSAYSHALLNMYDDEKLRLVDIPQEACLACLETCKLYWPSGVADTKMYEQESCYEIRMEEIPWNAVNEQIDARNARKLLCELFKTLHKHGWAVQLALKVTKDKDDQATFVLREWDKAEREYICLTPVGPNALHLINMPTTLSNQLKPIIRTMLKNNIQSERALPDNNYAGYEWQFNGHPWVKVVSEEAPDWLMARHVSVVFLAALRRLNCEVVGACPVWPNEQKSQLGAIFLRCPAAK